MKYPLAIVDKLLSTYGCDGAVFYDIGCAFVTTLADSSLAAKALSLNLCMLVGAFHSHAHNHKCQLDWHPLYVASTGNTESKGCEHVFSASNDLVQATWHATEFHRHQVIEQHFSFWSADKYASLGTLLIGIPDTRSHLVIQETFSGTTIVLQLQQFAHYQLS